MTRPRFTSDKPGVSFKHVDLGGPGDERAEVG